MSTLKPPQHVNLGTVNHVTLNPRSGPSFGGSSRGTLTRPSNKTVKPISRGPHTYLAVEGPEGAARLCHSTMAGLPGRHSFDLPVLKGLCTIEKQVRRAPGTRPCPECLSGRPGFRVVVHLLRDELLRPEASEPESAEHIPYTVCSEESAADSMTLNPKTHSGPGPRHTA